MITVSLHGAEFFAYHGFYPEEQKIGGRFIVDVEVSYRPENNWNDDKLINTIDYEQLYNLVSFEMKNTRKLIETVGQVIADQIRERHPDVESIKVSVKKLNPPLKGKVDYSAITISV